MESPDLADRILVARYLEQQGRFFTFGLHDQGNLIAATTVMIHRNDIIASVNYRKPEYDWYGVGDRLMDLVFTWAAQSGYNQLDIGGGQAYKIKWAPQAGERWLLNICPDPLYSAKQILNWLRDTKAGFVKNRNRVSEIKQEEIAVDC
jgi:hypothetical protein